MAGERLPRVGFHQPGVFFIGNHPAENSDSNSAMVLRCKITGSRICTIALPACRSSASGAIGTRTCELINTKGNHRNAESERRTLTERLAPLKQQFEWGDIATPEYTRKRDESKAAIAALKTPEVTEIVNAADYLQNMARV